MTIWILESDEVVCSRGDSAVVGAYTTPELAEQAANELELNEYDIFSLKVIG